jgi:hypothetical protein
VQPSKAAVNACAIRYGTGGLVGREEGGLDHLARTLTTTNGTPMSGTL